MIDKEQVAEVLEEIASILELKGENTFKVRAYTNAAKALDTLEADLATLVEEKKLGEIKGFGDALQQKITELVTTGRLAYYEELKASVPPGLFDMMKIPRLGPKKIKLLQEKLNITDVDALEQACRDNKVAGLAGFGEKTQLNILEGIEQMRSFATQHRYGEALPLATELVDALREHPDLTRVSVAGSLRRGKEVVKDIDIVASSKNARAIMDYFVALPGIRKVVNHGETKSSVLLEDGIACDLRVVSDREFPYALHHFTGSKDHNIAMRQRALSQGKRLSEWGLFELAPAEVGAGAGGGAENAGGPQAQTVAETADRRAEERGPLVVCHTEDDIFAALGLQPIPPELREGLGELEAAAENKIPRLIEWTNLRGTFHCHTSASDGRNSLPEMAGAAAALGLEYLGIADHSKSSFQAGGLNEARLEDQIRMIRHMNADPHTGIHLFAGSEVDILKDGSLDFNDTVLGKLDYTVASVHASFTLSEDEMTRRVIRAMENPHVTILGHATGRLLLSRAGYAINLQKIIEAAAATGTWIELNASTWRLELDWRWWRRARDLGVRCVITPDAHSINQMGVLRIGVTQARKGWLRSKDVVNTLSLKEMQSVLQEKRRKFGISGPAA
ncbi:histidinol-phosphatase [Verrucomicrobia bacterium LW23]|nr:histidinol-phosphatase [Verrucomicrobia bacterium LW23]